MIEWLKFLRRIERETSKNKDLYLTDGSGCAVTPGGRTCSRKRRMNSVAARIIVFWALPSR